MLLHDTSLSAVTGWWKCTNYDVDRVVDDDEYDDGWWCAEFHYNTGDGVKYKGVLQIRKQAACCLQVR